MELFLCAVRGTISSHTPPLKNESVPQYPITDQQLAKLCCLHTRTALRFAEPGLLDRYNRAVRNEEVRDGLGRIVHQVADSGLVDVGGTMLYPIVDGVVQLMRDESVPLSQFQ